MQPSEIAVALAEVWVRLAALMPGGRVDTLPGGVLVTTDVAEPSLRGPLVPLDDANAATIASARDITRRDGRSLAIDHIDGSVDLADLLGGERFERVVQRTVMTAPASIGRVTPAVRESDDDDIDALIRLEMDAFELSMDASAAMIGRGWRRNGTIRTVIDRDNGHRTPIASMATIHPTENGIGVFGVATAASSRNAGLARDVVLAGVAVAAAADDPRPVWLHCLPHLEPVYESMGFTAVTTSTVWVDGYA